MTSVFAAILTDNWPVMLDAHGVAATLTDAAGDTYSVTGVLTPRSDNVDLTVTWEEQATQAEFVCVNPSGFEFAPGECTVTVDTVEYTMMSEGVSNGSIHVYTCARTTLNEISHRGRRF